VSAQGGRFAGSVSGGCVEAAVLGVAAEVLAGPVEPRPVRALRFGVTSEQAWEVGLPCGGTIEVLLTEAVADTLCRLRAARDRRESISLLTDVASGVWHVWDGSTPEPLDGAARAGVEQIVRRERSELLEEGGRRWFVQVQAAPLRLVVVGAVHLAQALAELARMSGIEVTVVDPRTAFATAERFPGVNLVHDWPDVALDGLGLDRRTAVVVLSHDAKIDEPALRTALRSDCFYIGALGSKRTQQARRRRLAEEGFDEAQLSRIHGPVGVDIGALLAPEIAISIMAELIREWRRPAAPA
jgi:xanthine dehydrogenase accessory factor